MFNVTHLNGPFEPCLPAEAADELYSAKGSGYLLANGPRGPGEFGKPLKPFLEGEAAATKSRMSIAKRRQNRDPPDQILAGCRVPEFSCALWILKTL